MRWHSLAKHKPTYKLGIEASDPYLEYMQISNTKVLYEAMLLSMFREKILNVHRLVWTVTIETITKPAPSNEVKYQIPVF